MPSIGVVAVPDGSTLPLVWFGVVNLVDVDQATLYCNDQKREHDEEGMLVRFRTAWYAVG